jgi:hypothetical protein
MAALGCRLRPAARAHLRGVGHEFASRCRPDANTGSSGRRFSSSACRVATAAKRIRCGPSTGLRSGLPGDHVSQGALQVWAPAPAARFVSIVRRLSRSDTCPASCPCYRLATPNVNFSDTLSGARDAGRFPCSMFRAMMRMSRAQRQDHCDSRTWTMGSAIGGDTCNEIDLHSVGLRHSCAPLASGLCSLPAIPRG